MDLIFKNGDIIYNNFYPRANWMVRECYIINMVNTWGMEILTDEIIQSVNRQGKLLTDIFRIEE